MSREEVNILDFKIKINERCQLTSDVIKKKAFKDIDISREIESIQEKFTKKFEEIYNSIANGGEWNK